MTRLLAALLLARRAEARALLRVYVEHPEADELRRLRARQILLELAD